MSRLNHQTMSKYENEKNGGKYSNMILDKIIKGWKPHFCQELNSQRNPNLKHNCPWSVGNTEVNYKVEQTKLTSKPHLNIIQYLAKLMINHKTKVYNKISKDSVPNLKRNKTQ